MAQIKARQKKAESDLMTLKNKWSPLFKQLIVNADNLLKNKL